MPPEMSAHDQQPLDARDIAAVARGDRRALGALYDRYSSLMLGLGVRVLKNRELAEDVVHDVFIEVWKRAGQYDATRASVRSWIFMRMRSRCLDVVRSAKYRKTTFAEELDAGRLNATLPGEWVAMLPDDMVDLIRLRDLVRTLPERQREVLVLGYFKGMSSTEMAAQLSIPVGTVKSRVRAALAALRDTLGGSDAD